MSDNLPVPAASGALEPRGAGAVAPYSDRTAGNVGAASGPAYAVGRPPEDVALFDDFALSLARHRLPNQAEVMAIAGDWYDRLVAHQAQATSERDGRDRMLATERLRGRWGGKFQGNVSLVKERIADMPAEIAEKFFDARFPDGTAIANSPDVLDWILISALALRAPARPSAAYAPSAPRATQDSEIRELEELMRHGRSEYWKGPKAAENQAKYRRLIEQREQEK